MKRLFMLVLISVIVAGMSFAGTITVNSPNGGEVWKKGDVKNITWNSTDLTNLVKITLWKNGVFVGVIVKDQPQNGTYPWTVGSYQGGTAGCGTDYKINVREQGGPSFQTQDESNGNFEIKGCFRLDWDALKDKLRRFREIDWETVIVGPHGPGPVCLSCPPDFKWRHYVDLIKELGIKESVTLEIVRGNEVLGRKVVGGSMRLRKMGRVRTFRTLKIAKISEASGKAIREKGASVKLIVKNAQGKVIAQQSLKLNQRAARR